MSSNLLVFIIILFIAGTVLGALALAITLQVKHFKRELKYLNTEIEKSDGEERLYWEKRKKQLWLSLIPFVKF